MKQLTWGGTRVLFFREQVLSMYGGREAEGLLVSAEHSPNYIDEVAALARRTYSHLTPPYPPCPILRLSQPHSPFFLCVAMLSGRPFL